MKKILIASLLFSSCLSVEKAKQTVLTNKDAFSEVGEKWSELNPCNELAPDTVILDSFIFVPIPGKDIIIKQTDTLRKDSCDYATAYLLGYEEAVKAIKPVYRKETITLPPDTRAENYLRERAANLEKAASFDKARIEAIKEDNKKLRLYLLGSAILIFVLGIIIGKLLPKLFMK